MTRARGTGSITPHKGGFWARLRVEGKMTSFGIHPTYEVADDVLNKALIKRASVPGASASAVSFAAFGRRVLDMREEEGVRGVAAERRRWSRYLETCSFASKPIADVGPADIIDLVRTLAKKNAADHRETRKVTKETVQRTLTLARAVFAAAVQRELRTSNPCTGVLVKGARAGEDEEAWDWLRGEEQQLVLACASIEPWLKAMVRVAWGTGMRQGEMWNLELKDVHFARGQGCACGDARCIKLKERGPHVHVRYGAKGHLPPKNGCARRTPLFGEGLAGMTTWLDLLPAYAKENPLRLVFPSVTGCRRQLGAPERSSKRDAQGRQHKIDLLPEALKLAGVTRSIRWHDLRHTCASSLVSGSWGRTWELIEVRDMLGHKDIKTTQRYAHLCPKVLERVGAATPGHRVPERVPGNGPGALGVAAIVNDSVQMECEGGDLNPYASYGRGGPEGSRAVTIESTTDGTQAAADVLRAINEGRLDARDVARLLAESATKRT